MTPHCADQDADWLLRTMDIFNVNLENYCNGRQLNNIIDKPFAY